MICEGSSHGFLLTTVWVGQRTMMRRSLSSSQDMGRGNALFITHAHHIISWAAPRGQVPVGRGERAELVLERIVAVPPGHSWKKPKAGSDKLRE